MALLPLCITALIYRNPFDGLLIYFSPFITHHRNSHTQKCRLDYKLAYQTHKASPTQHTLTMYLDAHNSYVQQLHATNSMLESYHTDTLPQLLQELEDIYNDLCATVSEAVMQSTEVISGKVSVAREMGHGWMGGVTFTRNRDV